ncbi:hypothetical protein CRUP_021174, partial [Coryphaenoides rupestris]
ASAYPEVVGGAELPESKLPWSDEETLRLLEIWGQGSVQRGLQGCLKNRHIFTLIAQQLAAHGHRRSVEQCQMRIKRLKKAYRRCLKKNKRKTHKTECKFYEQLARVLGGPSGSAVTHDPEDDEEEDGDEEEVDDEQEPALDEDDDDLLYLGSTSREAISGSGTRSMTWSDVETLALVNIWGRDQVRNGTQRRGPVFPAIAAKMAARGYALPEPPEEAEVVIQAVLRKQDEEEEEEEEELELETIPLGAEPTDEDLSDAWHQEMGLLSSVPEAVERRKVPWSDKETVILLELWGDHQEQHRSRRGPHNGHVFTDIAARLAANGFQRSADQCHTRVKRLKASYRQCRENIRVSGTDKIDFKFYDLLEQIVEKQPSTSTLPTIEISEDSDSESRSADQCHTRVKRLKASYRQCRENIRVSGTDKIDFKFYDLLEQIVEKQPSTSTLPTIEISEDSDSESVNDAATPPAPRTPSSGWTDAETLALMGVWGEAGVRRALRGAVHTGRVSRRTQVDYKFYSQLEAILGQEVAAGDEEEEKEEEEDQDAAGANGTASGPWSEPETVALIRLWAADDVQESLRACVHNSHIYGDIANNMASLGHPRSAEQCQARMKNLKKTYRSFCSSRR